MTASSQENNSFVRSLASSDRPTREHAYESLTVYLKSGRIFTYIELLKIWKGLFYYDLNALQYRTRTTLSIIRHPLLPLLLSGIHHTANPLPQQRLSNSLASLLLDIPSEIFIPFLSAFYQTLISYWSSIPALRLDKYLYLVRVYVSHTFIYFSQHEWSQDLLDSWVAMTRGQRYSQGVLDPNDMKVSDGLRYHVLDVWIDGLVEATAWELNLKRGPLKPIQTIMDMGSSRTLKERAQRVISDERVSRLLSDTPNDAGEHELSDDEFIGFV